MKIIQILAIILLIMIPALATSVGISPENVNINLTQGQEYKISFIAVNSGNETTQYKITSDGDISPWIKFRATNVTMHKQEAVITSANVTIPTNLPDGIYKGNILLKSVLVQSTSGSSVSVQVNLPITIKVESNATPNIFIVVGILLIIIAIIIFVIYKRK